MLLSLITFALAGDVPPESSPEPEHPTVLFVHGMYMNGESWSQWVDWFGARGYDCLSPSWPYHDGEPASLRAWPPQDLPELGLDDVVDYYRAVIAELDEPPILIGHSMGGLVVQLLLQEGLGSAGVAIDSAPPKGVSSLRLSFLRSNAVIFGDRDEPILLSPEQFHYAFTNTLSEEDSRAIFEARVTPESKRVGRGPTTAVARIDFAAERPPLLLIAGEEDHIIPAALSRKNYRRYRKSPARTDLLEFEGRTHWIVAQDGWEEVAQATLSWLESLP